MKKLLQIFLFLLISLSISNPIFAKMVKGNGNVKSEMREVSNFCTIKVGGAFKIILMQNDDYSLKITADENLIEIIKTKVKNKDHRVFLDGIYVYEKKKGIEK